MASIRYDVHHKPPIIRRLVATTLRMNISLIFFYCFFFI